MNKTWHFFAGPARKLQQLAEMSRRNGQIKRHTGKRKRWQRVSRLSNRAKCAFQHQRRLLARAGAIFGLALVASGSLQAETTGPIESRVGFTDELTGARVEAVEPTGEDEYRVLVSMPGKKATAAPAAIEEIVVTGQRVPENELGLQGPRHEFIRDYANDRYGFYIYLSKQQKLPFRIYFKDHSAAEIHNH